MATTEDLRTGLPALDVPALWLERLTAVMSAAGTLLILAVMVLICADVVGRNAFGTPIAGVPEMVSMSILAIVFLQVANTLARGKLTRSEAFLGAVRRRAPRLGDALDALMHGAGVYLVFTLVTAFQPLFTRAYDRNQMVGAVGQFLAPIWPVYGIVLVGSMLLCAVFAMRALMLATRAVRGAP